MNLAASRAAIVLSACVLLSACERHASTPAPAPVAKPTPAPAVPAPAAPTITAEPAVEAVTDYVLPGALAPDVGPERLKQLFGAANVRIDDHLPGPEGEDFRGVILFADDPTRRAELHYQDEQQLRGLAFVSVREADTRWRLDNGIVMGMRLSELVRLNSKPIRFSGMGWDYGGTITDWNGGKLASRDGDPVMRGARLGLVPGGPSTQADAVPSSDADYASDDPKFPKQGELLRVEELSVSFPGEDDL
ncbi:hypothetical protein [Lysobacter sp. Root690]|uniref:hypothetical protein n=1 Tax=Lysobacter sp. Root690 TaxID=1736588 RepID=UPI0007008726|nr:hypothetical protein [Lysobacter sp. Root690]KRB02475.1 hypothetical protein ASD86_23390 [Lysobacter sp. Root690]